MTLYLNLDEFMYEHFKPFAPHTSVWSLEKPFTVSGLVNFPKQTYETLGNFLYSGKRAQNIPQ